MKRKKRKLEGTVLFLVVDDVRNGEGEAWDFVESRSHGTYPVRDSIQSKACMGRGHNGYRDEKKRKRRH